jgi:hypothetical protein
MSFRTPITVLPESLKVLLRDVANVTFVDIE